MKPLYINKKSHWHCQRQKASIILLASDFVTWTARYRLDLVFCLSYTDYKFICYLLLFSICLFVAAIYLFTRNLSPSCEISLNLVKTVLAFLFFFYLKPVSLRVLVFLVEYDLTNVDCIAKSSPPQCSYQKLFWKYAANVQENIRAEVWFQWSHTSASLFSCKFATYFQNTFL